MGLIDFVKDAGEKLFGRGHAQAAMTEAKSDPASVAKAKAANDAAGDAIVGYSAVARSEPRWTRHVAELRVLVGEQYRRGGLGRLLVTSAFRVAVDMGVEKMMAQMTVDQEGAISVFYRLGFEEEARLRNHVKDREGKAYDLIVLSQDVSEYQHMRQEHAAS